MPKSTSFANSFLDILLTATALANVWINATSSPITNLYLSLHTADPGVGGSQTTNEATFTNYARIAVVRSASGWTVASASAANAALAQFAQCGVTGNTITHVGLGRDSSGAGLMFYSGALTASRAVSSGIQPQFVAGSLTITEA